MAPTASSKRSRLPFSPPRPGISKVTKPTKDKTKNNKGITKRKSSGDINGDSGVPRSKPKPKPRVTSGVKEKGKRKQTEKVKQRGAGGTMRALLNGARDGNGDGDDDEDEDERQRHEEEDDDEENEVLNDIAARKITDIDTDEDTDSNKDTEESGSERHDLDNDDDRREDENENENEEDADENAPPASRLNFSSPEPDFILAEVMHSHTHTNTHNQGGTNSSSSPDSDEYPIPLPLIHRIMHAHFSVPNTVLSQHARALMGTYVGVFVKEAIRRCVDEKRERVKRGEGGDAGWLEVEDLERVGCQLVLDF
jgi:hypothetical protein